MYILNEDGKIEKGIPLTEEENQVTIHFENNVALGQYISSTDRRYLVGFLLKNYELHFRRPAAVDVVAETAESFQEKLDKANNLVADLQYKIKALEWHLAKSREELANTSEIIADEDV
jgi:hypothetical protein